MEGRGDFMKKPLKKGLKKPTRKPSKKITQMQLKKPSKKLEKKVSKERSLKVLKKPLKKISIKSAKKAPQKRTVKPSLMPISVLPAKTRKKPLWVPSAETVKNANMTRFIQFVNQAYGKKIKSYRDLYQWSINSIPYFWEAIWNFCEIRASRKYDQVVEDLNQFPGTKWFPGAKLNFAENLLRYRDDQPAFIFRGENQKIAKMTYQELYHTVARLATSLRNLGIAPGDRVLDICQT